jgi:D-glycero-D-manno-heptose 1,7-bisphosphate phosphatase|tara:strand:- start:2026 stop:2556 length:531 start_codon:yes stop_codon:yes gene_type:complete
MASFVILDRDGVINQDSMDYIKSADEWMPIPGSLEAIALLTSNNIDVYIATNQAGIARGKLTLDALNCIHEKLVHEVESAGGRIVDIKFCPHHPDENCWCRKPNPGLLEDLATTHQLNLAEGYYVGDSLKDLRAAASAGCTGILVLTGNGIKTQQLRPHHEYIFSDLLAFAQDMTS